MTETSVCISSGLGDDDDDDGLYFKIPVRLISSDVLVVNASCCPGPVMDLITVEPRKMRRKNVVRKCSVRGQLICRSPVTGPSLLNII